MSSNSKVLIFCHVSMVLCLSNLQVNLNAADFGKVNNSNSDSTCVKIIHIALDFFQHDITEENSFKENWALIEVNSISNTGVNTVDIDYYLKYYTLKDYTFQIDSLFQTSFFPRLGKPYNILNSDLRDYINTTQDSVYHAKREKWIKEEESIFKKRQCKFSSPISISVQEGNHRNITIYFSEIMENDKEFSLSIFISQSNPIEKWNGVSEYVVTTMFIDKEQLEVVDYSIGFMSGLGLNPVAEIPLNFK